LSYLHPVLTITDDDAKPSRRQPRKGRAFSVNLVAMLTWGTVRKSDHKMKVPVFLDFVGTESEHRAFVANLRCGRAATIGTGSSSRFELPRSDTHIFAPPSRCDFGVRQIVYLAEIFDLEVKAPSATACCVAMPPLSLLSTVTTGELDAVKATVALLNQQRQRQADEMMAAFEAAEAARGGRYYYSRPPDVPKQLDLDDETMRYWALIARELCVRLDSRTEYPVPPEPEFRALFLYWLGREGCLWCESDNPLRDVFEWRNYGYNSGFATEGRLDAGGYCTPIGLAVPQEKLGTLLTEAVRAWCG
jgi:hypothetical protein